MTVLSIVVPVFNEKDAIPVFLRTIVPFLDSCTSEWEVVFVNDGSRDATWFVIKAFAAVDSRVRGVSLSRNFGKEAALRVGLAEARGTVVVPMGVDCKILLNGLWSFLYLASG